MRKTGDNIRWSSFALNFTVSCRCSCHLHFNGSQSEFFKWLPCPAGAMTLAGVSCLDTFGIQPNSAERGKVSFSVLIQAQHLQLHHPGIHISEDPLNPVIEAPRARP